MFSYADNPSGASVIRVWFFSMGSQVSLSVALGIPTRKRKPVTEAELELRRQRREEAAAKRAKMQEEMKKKQEEQKYKKK